MIELKEASVEVQLVEVLKENDCNEKDTKDLQTNFTPFMDQAKDWAVKAKAIVVTDIDQVDLMKDARTARLALKNIRVEANKKRSELKEDSLRYGKAVQGAYHIIEYMIKPIEEHLEKQEQFVFIQEKKKREELQDSRSVELLPYEEFAPSNLNLGAMSQHDYTNLFNGAKMQFDEKVSLQKKAEDDRIELKAKKTLFTERKGLLLPYTEFADWDQLTNFSIDTTHEDWVTLMETAENNKIEHDRKAEEKRKRDELDRKKVEADNKKLKDQAIANEKKQAESDAKIKAENDAREKKETEDKAKQVKIDAKLKADNDAKLKAEREAKEKAEAELKSKRDAEIKAEQDKQDRIEAELKKGDTDKFNDLLSDLETLKNKYQFKSAKNKKMYSDVGKLIDKVVSHIKK